MTLDKAILFLSSAASKEFIEARKRALKRFLMLVVRHPVLCEDKIVNFFLTVKGSVSLLLPNNKKSLRA